MSNLVYRRAVDLLEADINDELVGLDPIRGSCFGMNEVAKDLWRKLETPRSLGELTSSLIAEYDVSEDQCAAELKEFLADMEAKGLIASERLPGNHAG